MLFRSRIKRQFWIISFLPLIPDFIICLFASWFFNFSFWGAVLIFIVLEVSLMFLSFFRSLLIWTYSLFVTKEFIKESFIEDFTRYKFPKPDLIEDSAVAYLNKVALGENNKPDKKFIASFYLGYLECFNSCHQILQKITLINALEDAVAEITSSESENGRD